MCFRRSPAVTRTLDNKYSATKTVKHDERLHFLTFAESKLWSKYLLKSKSEVISLSENMATNTDSLVN